MESGSIFYQLKANELIENGSDKFEVEENLKNNPTVKIKKLSITMLSMF